MITSDSIFYSKQFLTYCQFLSNTSRLLRFEVDIEKEEYLSSWNLFKKPKVRTHNETVSIEVKQNGSHIERVDYGALKAMEKDEIRKVISWIEKTLKPSQRARKVDLTGYRLHYNKKKIKIPI